MHCGHPGEVLQVAASNPVGRSRFIGNLHRFPSQIMQFGHPGEVLQVAASNPVGRDRFIGNLHRFPSQIMHCGHPGEVLHLVVDLSETTVRAITTIRMIVDTSITQCTEKN